MELSQLMESLDFSSKIWIILTPLIMMLLDIITGYVQALINKEVKSYIMRIGILHKICLIVVMVISHLLDYAFNFHTIAKVVSIYLVVMEITSIFENLKKAGVDLGKLLDFFKTNKEVK